MGKNKTLWGRTKHYGDKQNTMGTNNQMGTNKCGHTNERTKSAGYLIEIVHELYIISMLKHT